eukprot:6188747-Amphidinium_carterae.1
MLTSAANSAAVASSSFASTQRKSYSGDYNGFKIWITHMLNIATMCGIALVDVCLLNPKFQTVRNNRKRHSKNCDDITRGLGIPDNADDVTQDRVVLQEEARQTN